MTFPSFGYNKLLPTVKPLTPGNFKAAAQDANALS